MSGGSGGRQEREGQYWGLYFNTVGSAYLVTSNLSLTSLLFNFSCS